MTWPLPCPTSATGLFVEHNKWLEDGHNLTMITHRLKPLRVSAVILCLCYAACLVRGSAETKKSILRSFEGYVEKKIRKTKPADGIVCSKPGTKPKSTACFDKVGKQNCVAAKQAFENLPDKTKRAIYYSRGSRGVAPPVAYSHDKRCPFPCGCWLASPPKVNGKAKTKVWKGEGATWKQIESVLKSWNVPRELRDQFEMATMFDDKSTFVNFDFYLQPDGNKAEYEVALGAARKYNGIVEIGYLYAGKSSAIVSPSYKCGRAKKKKGGFFGKGGTHEYCNRNGIPPSKIEKVKQALEYFAFKTIRFDNNDNNNMDVDSDQENANFVENLKDDFDIDLPNEDDDSLWQLDDDTKYLIGDQGNRYGGREHLFQFDSGANKKHVLLQRSIHHNSDCHGKNKKVMRWIHQRSERCPFDFIEGHAYVAKLDYDDPN